ncbi:hypothetical protein [Bacillus horti]|uniref:Uncharacterized protein n=1 Tax=Caldalkalibacillus horti TaxID=77523 RepID=A0ABT9W433_9BACI|nr:hypothetical protein [Bacillus horti]MDQ0167852.1 hypothetical protein [Bacillus horti]
MGIIYGVAAVGFILFLLVLTRTVSWSSQSEWTSLEGAEGEHGEVRQWAAMLEGKQIQTRVELKRKMTTLRLLYSNKDEAMIKVRLADHQKAKELFQVYQQQQENKASH